MDCYIVQDGALVVGQDVFIQSPPPLQTLAPHLALHRRSTVGVILGCSSYLNQVVGVGVIQDKLRQSCTACWEMKES